METGGRGGGRGCEGARLCGWGHGGCRKGIDFLTPNELESYRYFIN